MNCVYRLAPKADWEAAVASGAAYTGGQLDKDSGYIHLSTHSQVRTAPPATAPRPATRILTHQLGLFNSA